MIDVKSLILIKSGMVARRFSENLERVLLVHCFNGEKP